MYSYYNCCIKYIVSYKVWVVDSMGLRLVTLSLQHDHNKDLFIVGFMWHYYKLFKNDNKELLTVKLA